MLAVEERPAQPTLSNRSPVALDQGDGTRQVRARSRPLAKPSVNPRASEIEIDLVIDGCSGLLMA